MNKFILLCFYVVGASHVWLKEIRLAIARGANDPDEIWMQVKGDELVRCEPSDSRTRSLLLIFAALVESRNFIRGFRRWEIAQRNFCRENEKEIVELIEEDFQKWRLRWTMERELARLDSERYAVELIVPFWNFEKICPIIVEENFSILKLIVSHRIFKNIYTGGSERRRTYPYRVAIRETSVLDDSVSELVGRKFSDFWDRKIVGRISVGQFKGGFSGWISAVVHNLVREGILIETELGTQIFTVNPSREISDKYLHFLGIILALCLIEGTIFDVQLSLGIFKYLLNESAVAEELEKEYPSIFQQLSELDFEKNAIFFGANLLDGGDSMQVTRENVLRYDRLMANWKLVKSLKKQLSIVKKGFVQILGIEKWEKISDFLPAYLSAMELQRIVCGPEIILLENVKVAFDFTRWGLSEWPQPDREIFMTRVEKFFRYLNSQGRMGEFLKKIFGNEGSMESRIIIALRFEFDNPDAKLPMISSRENRLSVPMYSSDEIFIERMMHLL